MDANNCHINVCDLVTLSKALSDNYRLDINCGHVELCAFTEFYFSEKKKYTPSSSLVLGKCSRRIKFEDGVCQLVEGGIKNTIKFKDYICNVLDTDITYHIRATNYICKLIEVTTTTTTTNTTTIVPTTTTTTTIVTTTTTTQNVTTTTTTQRVETFIIKFESYICKLIEIIIETTTTTGLVDWHTTQLPVTTTTTTLLPITTTTTTVGCPAAIWVCGAGHESVNMGYTMGSGSYGKPDYESCDGNSIIYWHNLYGFNMWVLTENGGDHTAFYYSDEDTVTPDLVLEWHTGIHLYEFIGALPVPTVNTIECITTTTTTTTTIPVTTTTTTITPCSIVINVIMNESEIPEFELISASLIKNDDPDQYELTLEYKVWTATTFAECQTARIEFALYKEDGTYLITVSHVFDNEDDNVFDKPVDTITDLFIFEPDITTTTTTIL